MSKGLDQIDPEVPSKPIPAPPTHLGFRARCHPPSAPRGRRMLPIKGLHLQPSPLKPSPQGTVPGSLPDKAKVGAQPQKSWLLTPEGQRQLGQLFAAPPSDLGRKEQHRECRDPQCFIVLTRHAVRRARLSSSAGGHGGTGSSLGTASSPVPTPAQWHHGSGPTAGWPGHGASCCDSREESPALVGPWLGDAGTALCLSCSRDAPTFHLFFVHRWLREAGTLLGQRLRGLVLL